MTELIYDNEYDANEIKKEDVEQKSLQEQTELDVIYQKVIQNSRIEGPTLKIGRGSSILRFDPKYGLWAGGADFSSAPFRVNMSGAVVATNITASGYNRVYKQASIPTADNEGDLWIDTDNGNKNYRAASSGADEITAGEWEEVTTKWGGVQDDGNKPDNNATQGAEFDNNITGGGSANNQVTNAGYATRFLRQLFGDGSDGNVTISSNTTLARDMFYDDLTIDSGYTLDTNGWRIFVKGTLTNNGTIEFTPGVAAMVEMVEIVIMQVVLAEEGEEVAEAEAVEAVV